MLPELPRLLAQGNRALELATGGTCLLGAVRRAAAGDEEAAAYLKQDGVHDAADLLVPGAGSLSRTFREQLGALRGGRLVEGEYRVLDGQAAYPWQPCLRWIVGQEYGTYCVLGPKGGGKTKLAFRLAEVWHARTGYPVTAINCYSGDVPAFAEKRPSWWFVDLMRRLVGILDPPRPAPKKTAPRKLVILPNGRTAPDADDEPDDDDEMDFEPTFDDEVFIEKHRNRIFVIDEMSSFIGPNPGDAKRELVRKLMHQARHMGFLIIYAGQIAKHLPEDLLNCQAIFVKRPLGDERVTDRDNPLVTRLWEDAGAAFEALRDSPWRALNDGLYFDLRSWAYVYCREVGTEGYFGPMPFQQPTMEGGERP